MTTGLYLSAMSQNSGKSLVALGLADSLTKRRNHLRRPHGTPHP